jgi:hypothetical protein
MYTEKELTEENSNDVFTCKDCRCKTTRGDIRKKWKQIPFVEEETNNYYCGCSGWN